FATPSFRTTSKAHKRDTSTPLTAAQRRTEMTARVRRLGRMARGGTRRLSEVARATTTGCTRLCAAIVDRLTFNGTIVETGTDSYRLASTRARAEEPPKTG
ncbi:hypothetical protein AB0C64_44290, partial [Streptomyces sp900116325]